MLAGRVRRCGGLDVGEVVAKGTGGGRAGVIGALGSFG